MVGKLSIKHWVGDRIANGGEHLGSEERPDILNEEVEADTAEPNSPAKNHKQYTDARAPPHSMHERSEDTLRDEEYAHSPPGVEYVPANMLHENRIDG
jgi:hypothetical protein